MFAQVGAVGSEEDDGAVKCSTVPFNHADYQIHVTLRRTTSKVLHCQAGNIHSTFPVATVLFASFGGAIPDHSAETEATRIGRHKGFWEDHEVCSLAGSICSQYAHLFEGPFSVECNRCRLNNSCTDNSRMRSHELFHPPDTYPPAGSVPHSCAKNNPCSSTSELR